MPGLGASFGRGAATNYQQDMANSDCMLFMGSNMAEAQPVGFRWPMKAKEKGATLIHVDPRFTRMSAVCDLYVGIRSGSDITFLGGLVNYVLTNDRWFHEYVLAYTNASTIIEEGFQDTEDLAGLFSGFGDEATHIRAKQVIGATRRRRGPDRKMFEQYCTGERRKDGMDLHGHGARSTRRSILRPQGQHAERDPTLQHPHCVMQILRGISRATRHRSSLRCAAVSRKSSCAWRSCSAPTPDASGPACIAYALGWTQHTTGVQIIRTAGILQLLLGNMGRPGGGIMALRGHSTIQGRPTFRLCTTRYLAICRNRLPRPDARDTEFVYRARRDCPPATGRISANSSSASSRRGMATPPRLRTISVLVAAARGWRLLAAGLFRSHGQGAR